MLEADKLNNSLSQSNSALQIGFPNINPMAKMQVLLRLCFKKILWNQKKNSLRLKIVMILKHLFVHCFNLKLLIQIDVK